MTEYLIVSREDPEEPQPRKVVWSRDADPPPAPPAELTDLAMSEFLVRTADWYERQADRVGDYSSHNRGVFVAAAHHFRQAAAAYLETEQ